MRLFKLLILCSITLNLILFCSINTFGFWDSLFKVDVNVILFTLDTLQAKSLGCYGYPLETSPNLDKLADESFVFNNAFVVSNHTVPSHASILSSKWIVEILPLMIARVFFW